ncbi:phage holin family protein [Novosphingobium malaysiense]|uniref:Superfamily III holin-X n=1 Tax=Novosphingobium malaysiense TaxID=1348853 RepID=A0A0B1ZPR9_9SPHN|nr:phage holin family protein [Novosphingobium malaysiense]KHK91268.1 hypothetical protein LK12_10285 [Novosphingobium malaysiense]
MTLSSDEPAPLAEQSEDPTIAEDLRQLADEAKTLAQAELAFQKSRTAYAGSQSKTIAALLVVAAVLVFFAVMAMVTGTVIALGPVLGLWGAMAAVTLSLFVLAGVCALAARSRFKHMMAIVSDGKGSR